MAFFGADTYIVQGSFADLDQLFQTHQGSKANSARIVSGVRAALSLQLGMGKTAEFFRAADHLMTRPECPSIIAITLADHVKFQLDKSKSTPQDIHESRKAVFNILGELQERPELLRCVQKHLAPTLLFAIASRVMVEKVSGRLIRSEAQGAPVIILREKSKTRKQTNSFRVLVNYGSTQGDTIIVGSPKRVVLDVIKRHDGTEGRSLNEAAAVIFRIQQCFWDLSTQVSKTPQDRQDVFRQMDLTRSYLRSKRVLAGAIPGLKAPLNPARTLSRESKKYKDYLEQGKVKPTHPVGIERIEATRMRIAQLKEFLTLCERQQMLRRKLRHDADLQRIYNSRRRTRSRFNAQSQPKSA